MNQYVIGGHYLLSNWSWFQSFLFWRKNVTGVLSAIDCSLTVLSVHLKKQNKFWGLHFSHFQPFSVFQPFSDVCVCEEKANVSLLTLHTHILLQMAVTILATEVFWQFWLGVGGIRGGWEKIRMKEEKRGRNLFCQQQIWNKKLKGSLLLPNWMNYQRISGGGGCSYENTLKNWLEPGPNKCWLFRLRLLPKGPAPVSQYCI